MDKSMRTESESSPKQPGTTTMAKAARRVFLGICWCNGILAVIFGSLMIASPSGELLGMQQLLVEMQSWPNAHIFFKDLVWPGIALILVNGVSNLIALAFWMARHRIHTILGAASGAMLVAWTTFQLMMIPNPISVVYMAIGATQLAAGVYLSLKRA